MARKAARKCAFARYVSGFLAGRHFEDTERQRFHRQKYTAVHGLFTRKLGVTLAFPAQVAV